MRINAVLVCSQVKQHDQGWYSILCAMTELGFKVPGTPIKLVLFFQVSLDPDESQSPMAIQIAFYDPDLNQMAITDVLPREPSTHHKLATIGHTVTWEFSAPLSVAGPHLIRIWITGPEGEAAIHEYPIHVSYRPDNP